MNTLRIVLLWSAAVVISAGAATAQLVEKQALSAEVYDTWYSIGGQRLSPDGRWLIYTLSRTGEDDELRLKDLRSDEERIFSRAGSARFTEDGARLIFQIRPARGAQRGGRGAEQAADSVAILELETGVVDRIARIRSFRTAGAGAGWLAYHLDRVGEEARLGAPEPDTAADAARGNGTLLVVRNLETGQEREYPGVASYFFAGDAARLFYVTATGEAERDGIFAVDMARDGAEPVMTGPGRYRDLAADDAGNQLTFLYEAPAAEAEGPEAETAGSGLAVYHWSAGRGVAVPVVEDGSPGIPPGWQLSGFGSPSFSQDGRRLYFSTAPAAEEEAGDGAGDVKVDIWHWLDPEIQPVQLRRTTAARRQNYRAVLHLADGGRIVQLETPELASVSVGDRGDSDLAIGTSSEPYRIENQWETPNLRDVYLVDVRTGEQQLLMLRTQSGPSFSPGLKYLFWWDREAGGWLVLDLAERRVRDIGRGVPAALHNEDFDQPQSPPAYGNAGWTEGDAEFLVYSRHDIWALDPTGRREPRDVTHSVGEAGDLRLRLLRVGWTERHLDLAEPMMLSAFSYATKAAGFYRMRLRGDRPPERLVMRDESYSTPSKAEAADVMLYTRSTIGQFPDLWVSDVDFRAERRVTGANPQQSEYIWATAELVNWRSADGIPLQGILYKPENFDPSSKYPMITYFYERSSGGLHRYYVPEPHRSAISPLVYASRGYLVFIPDIVYRIGYPGESALNAVVPGVLHLLERSYVDEARLGVQGHSWGGYQIAYMVTRTNVFRAAAAGAPVGNMISAYGGIRWQTGLSRQFQYERTQSRLGGNLWEMPVRYIENSPIFWMDKVETPVLFMHNDQDGHVPWEQGVELFLALRRLGKPTWLINYNDEPHWPTTEANKRDWQLRLEQFFDHYLKDSPPAVWMVEGVPAARKGQTLGTDLVQPDSSAGIAGGRLPNR